MINNRMRIEQQRMVDNGEGNDNKQATMQLRKVNTVWKENFTERKTSSHAIRHTVIKVISGLERFYGLQEREGWRDNCGIASTALEEEEENYLKDGLLKVFLW